MKKAGKAPVKPIGNTLVLDPKGESSALTANWRKNALGDGPAVFDPFAVVEKSPKPRRKRKS